MSFITFQRNAANQLEFSESKRAHNTTNPASSTSNETKLTEKTLRDQAMDYKKLVQSAAPSSHNASVLDDLAQIRRDLTA